MERCKAWPNVQVEGRAADRRSVPSNAVLGIAFSMRIEFLVDLITSSLVK
jgi:hypothetical protein